jgi:hypothetical protein
VLDRRGEQGHHEYRSQHHDGDDNGVGHR